MEPDIKITGKVDPVDPTRCAFEVDRPVYPNRSFYFPDRAKAAGSPLVSRIFDIAGIETVLVSHDTVTVTAQPDVEWQVVGREIGPAIRSALSSEEAPIDPKLHESLPQPEVLREVVGHLIATHINPQIASHGGVVRLVDVQQNVLFIEMGGGCQGCGMASATLRGGVERLVREMVPEVGEILDVTDHAAGRNPYYSSR